MAITFYEVRQYDQLYQILRQHYGSASFLKDKAGIVRLIQANNPSISNVDLIRPGQIVMLPDLQTATSSSSAPARDIVRSCELISSGLAKHNTSTQALLSSIDFMKINQAGAEGFVSFVDKTTKAAHSDLYKIALNYYRKEAGTISRNQYNYQRSLSVKHVAYKLGPLHQLINPGQKPGQVLRIQPHAAIRPQAILDQADQLARISRTAKIGGVVLSAGLMGITAAQIHQADRNTDRSVLLLDTVTGLGGQLAGTALAVLVIGTPAGWLSLALILTTGIVGNLAADAIGKVIQEKALYDVNGNRVNTFADRMWEPLYGKN